MFELKMNFSSLDELQEFMATLPPSTHAGRLAAPVHHAPAHHASVPHHVPATVHHPVASSAPARSEHRPNARTVQHVKDAMAEILREQPRKLEPAQIAAIVKKFVPSGNSNDLAPHQVDAVLEAFERAKLGIA